MAMTAEQMEQAIGHIDTVYRELSQRVAQLQQRVAELEKAAMEEVGEYEEPED